jgi:hypothetical protein
MIAQLHLENINISEIHVIDSRNLSRAAIPVAWPTEENEERMYPAASAEVQSLVFFDDTNFSKSRRALIEINHTLDKEEFESFEQWIEPWYQVLEAGAFLSPIIFIDERGSIAGTVNQFDEFTVEVQVNRFVASEQIWLVLANIANEFWRSRGGFQKIIVS